MSRMELLWQRLREVEARIIRDMAKKFVLNDYVY